MTGDGTAGAQPLAGIRVADFSRVLAGPYATMLLADVGADVIKIESPAGDDTRAWAPPVDEYGDATYFSSVNRGKRSVVCDLNTPVGLAEAQRLAASADIVIENFRPGVMARFGLDYEAVRAVNPGAIYCSITGFGGGAGAGLAGYDLLVQAVGGLMSVTGSPEGGPTKVGVALVDVLTGMNAYSGILLALRERDRSGVGQRIEIDLLSSLLSALVNQASGTLATGVSPGRLGNAHPSIAPYEMFHAADRELVIAVGNDRQFSALVGALDAAGPAAGLAATGLAGDARFATNPQRVANRDALHVMIEDRLATASAAAWVSRFSTVGVPAGLVNSVAEAIAFAESLGLAPVAETADDERRVRTIANPGHHPGVVYRTPPPRLGADTGADWLEKEVRP